MSFARYRCYEKTVLFAFRSPSSRASMRKIPPRKNRPRSTSDFHGIGGERLAELSRRAKLEAALAKRQNLDSVTSVESRVRFPIGCLRGHELGRLSDALSRRFFEEWKVEHRGSKQPSSNKTFFSRGLLKRTIIDHQEEGNRAYCSTSKSPLVFCY